MIHNHVLRAVTQPNPRLTSLTPPFGNDILSIVKANTAVEITCQAFQRARVMTQLVLHKSSLYLWVPTQTLLIQREQHLPARQDFPYEPTGKHGEGGRPRVRVQQQERRIEQVSADVARHILGSGSDVAQRLVAAH